MDVTLELGFYMLYPGTHSDPSCVFAGDENRTSVYVMEGPHNSRVEFGVTREDLDSDATITLRGGIGEDDHEFLSLTRIDCLFANCSDGRGGQRGLDIMNDRANTVVLDGSENPLIVPPGWCDDGDAGGMRVGDTLEIKQKSWDWEKQIMTTQTVCTVRRTK